MANTRWGQNRWGAERWYLLGPDTIDDYLNGNPWDRVDGGLFESPYNNSSASGVSTLPETLGGADGSTAITASRTKIFKIEIRNKIRALVCEITNWTFGEITQDTEKPGSVKFTIAASDANASDITRENRIWIRDRWGFLVDMFNLSKKTARREGDATFIDIEGVSAISQLTKEPITYSTPTQFVKSGDTITVTPVTVEVGDILRALLSTQTQTPKIGIGFIDKHIAERKITFSIDNSNIYQAIIKLWKQLPAHLSGHIRLNARNNLDWHAKIGWRKNQSALVGEMLQNESIETDYSKMFTRLYMYGEGEQPKTRLNLTDAGEANEYIDSANTATYGVISKTLIDKRIKYPASLLERAQRELNDNDEPVVTLSINLLDLAKDDGSLFAAFDDICLGSDYDVVDSALGIDTTVTIRTTTTDMSNPVLVKVDLGNRAAVMGDLFESVFNNLNSPLEVADDGSKYPNITRTFDGEEMDSGDEDYIENLIYREGDLRSTSDGLAYRDGLEWRKITPMYEAASFAALPSTGIESHALARTTDDATIYKRDDTNTAWEEVASGDTIAAIEDDITALEVQTLATDVWKITGGSSENWTIQRADVSNTLYGATYSGVKVITGHSQSVASGDYVNVVFPLTLSTGTERVPRIVNAFRVETT